VPLVLTTGGTGLGPRDVTPEATRSILDREVPGLAEHARRATRVHTPFAILSRGVAGIRRRTLIVNLPGSPKGARETFDAIAPVLPHALAIVAGGDDHPGP
jgi:molybdenum cofactor synthesis domain-containing protein